MRLRDALALPALSRLRVVAGEPGLNRPVRWVHVVDIPDVRSWVRPGHLLLTTGYAWPRDEAGQKALIRDLNDCGLAGVAMAVPQFFERFPPPAVEQAEELGFPLLEVPWEIPFATITETITRAILSEQSALLERSEAIHRALTRAALELDSLEAIVRRIAVTLNRPCGFFDAAGQLMAFHNPYGEATANGHVSEIFQRGCVAPAEARKVFQEAHCPVQVSVDGRGWLIGPVRLGKRLLGAISLVSEDDPFHDLDLRAVEQAATVVALYFSYQQRVDMVQTRLRFGFVDSLIEGRWDMTPAALERARLLGFDPEATYLVVVFLLRKELVPLDGEDAFMRRERVATDLRRHLADKGIAPLLTVTLNRVVVLLPEQADVRSLWALFDPEEVAVGVSEPCRGVDAIPEGFRQAVQALEWGERRGYCDYKETLLPRVLSGDASAREAFVMQTLGPILKSDAVCQRLLATLYTLARNDFSFSLTAKRLHIHPNTLRYRVRCMEEKLGVDFSDPETRFRIRLAVEILNVNHKFVD